MAESIALLEYYTTASRTVILLARADLPSPLLFEAREEPGGRPVTAADLRDCADRMLVDFHGLPAGWDQEGNLQRFRRVLELPPRVHAAKRQLPLLQKNLGKPAFQYDLTYWERLSSALLPPELRPHIEDCELLCIVPHGPLHLLPFAALRWSEETYLIERFGLCQAPSATVLRHCQAKNRRRREKDHRPGSCLVAAVASAEDADPGDFERDAWTLEELFRSATKLVGTAAEDGALPAAKEAFQRLAPGHDILHLACHGIFGMRGAADALDACGLLVSDGRSRPPLQRFPELEPAERSRFFLSAREVFRLHLSSDLVVLRACSSGRSHVEAGDELLGLSRAFLYAGTPSLIVTLWDVNKISSRLLLDEFYRSWMADDGSPEPKWRAFQKAQQGLLRSPPERGNYRHPYHWAPFNLIGDWL